MKGEAPEISELQKKVDEANLLLRTDSSEARKLATEVVEYAEVNNHVQLIEMAKSVILSSYYVVGDTDNLRDGVKKYKADLKDQNTEEFKGLLYQYEACYLFLTRQIDEAKKVIDKAIKIFHRHNNHKRVIICYHIQAAIFYSSYELVEAFKSYDKFLDSCDDFPEIDTLYIINAIVNMGYLFIMAEDYHEAQILIEEGVKLLDDSGKENLNTRFTTYANLALCKIHVHRYIEVPTLLKAAEEVLEKLGSEFYKLYIYGLWGEYYYHINDYAKAEEFTLLATDGKLKSNNKEYIELDRYVLLYCQTMGKLGRFNEVDELLEEYISLLERLNIDFEKAIAFEKIAELYVSVGEHEKACIYFSKWKDMHAKLLSRKERLRESKVERKEKIKARREEFRHKEALDLKNKELTNFIRMASHDMKNPLRNIKQFGELIEKGKIDNEQKEFLGYIKDSSDKMDKLLMDLLQYTNVGFEEDSRTMIELASVIKGSCSELENMIEESQVKIILGSMLNFKSDLKNIQTLIFNMISHCISRTLSEKDSFIKISCRDLDDFIQIVIEDNGMEIEQAQLENIFDPFTRLRLSEGHSDNSLKLATCKRIVDKLNGQISVESSQKLGSKFHISLPKDYKDLFYH